MLSVFEYDIYLEKIFTLNSMADLLEYLERKQPRVGKKPQRLHFLGVFGHCSQRLGDNGSQCRPRTLLGFRALSLYTQEPNSSGSRIIASGCFFPIAVEKMYIV